MQKILKIVYYLNLFSLLLIYCLELENKKLFLEDNIDNIRDEIININIIGLDNTIYIGNERNFYFNTDFHDYNNIFDSNMEENTSFETKVETKGIIYRFNIKCRLWKPTNGNFKILCKMISKYTSN